MGKSRPLWFPQVPTCLKCPLRRFQTIACILLAGFLFLVADLYDVTGRSTELSSLAQHKTVVGIRSLKAKDTSLCNGFLVDMGSESGVPITILKHSKRNTQLG